MPYPIATGRTGDSKERRGWRLVLRCVSGGTLTLFSLPELYE